MFEPMYYNEFCYSSNSLSKKNIVSLKDNNPKDNKSSLEKKEEEEINLENPLTIKLISEKEEEKKEEKEEKIKEKEDLFKKEIFINNFLLNPLTVIIKLSILSFKPIGTKIHIQNNIIYFQEPGIFQSLTRYIFNSNKSHLQYLYFPIKMACKKYLTKEYIQKYPKITYLFLTANKGIEKLMKTYSSCSITILCLKYFLVILSSYLNQSHDDLFIKNTDSLNLELNSMNEIYKEKLLEKLENQWNPSKLNIFLDLMDFLLNNSEENNLTNLKSIETIINNNDEETQKIISSFKLT